MRRPRTKWAPGLGRRLPFCLAGCGASFIAPPISGAAPGGARHETGSARRSRGRGGWPAPGKKSSLASFSKVTGCGAKRGPASEAAFFGEAARLPLPPPRRLFLKEKVGGCGGVRTGQEPRRRLRGEDGARSSRLSAGICGASLGSLSGLSLPRYSKSRNRF